MPDSPAAPPKGDQDAPRRPNRNPRIVGRSISVGLAEIDDLAPVEPGIDPADGAAFSTFEVGGDVVPVPIGKVMQPQAAVMMAAMALRSKAIDQDGLEARVPIHGAGPISEEVSGFSAPWHPPLIPLICGQGKPLGIGAGESCPTEVGWWCGCDHPTIL